MLADLSRLLPPWQLGLLIASVVPVLLVVLVFLARGRQSEVDSSTSWYYTVYPLVLFFGYVLNWWNSQRVETARGKMSRINEQLKEFYGPLQGIIATTRRSHEAMLQEFFNVNATHLNVNAEGFNASDAWEHALDTDPAAVIQYQVWAREVLQPLNEQAFRIIVQRSDLLDTTAVPLAFHQFVAHVTAFRTVLARWNAGDFSVTRCVARYPKGLEDYINAEFRRLKLDQAADLDHLDQRHRGETEEQLATGIEFVGGGPIALARVPVSSTATTTAAAGPTVNHTTGQGADTLLAGGWIALALLIGCAAGRLLGRSAPLERHPGAQRKKKS